MQYFKTLQEFEEFMASLSHEHPLYKDQQDTVLQKRTVSSISVKSKKINNKYHNLHSIRMDMSLDRIIGMSRDYITKDKRGKPNFVLPKIQIDATQFQKFDALIWLGHSTILGHIDNVTFILDPMLSKRASPFQCLGPKRFEGSLTPIEELPDIDVILITHNHYDHLDYASIIGLQKKVKAIFVPLDNGKILRNWGVDNSKIIEFDWFEDIIFQGVKFSFCPTQHFSGRGLIDRDRYLWGSWAIRGRAHAIYVSGDGGYNDHFKMIAKHYGPFDIACMECGAYNSNWSEIHMTPEESVQATIDLNGQKMLPMHWAGFDLSTHAWNEPVNRAIEKAKELDVPIITPIIGDIVSLHEPTNNEKWWFDPNSL